MKLIRCYIENFGGLQQYSVNFEDGLTVIFEPNGFGKTTLAEFIRAMFYGFPRAAKDIQKNPRLKYLPWQGGRYGGYLIFEHCGKHYRIDRTFGDTPRQDKAALFNEVTHRETNDFSPDSLGIQLFGMDSESFLRSTYMPQSPVSGSLYTDSIRAKLGNLLEDNNDLAGFEKAIQRLKDKRSTYEHYRGTGGSIHETQKQITALQTQLEACRAKQPRLEQTAAEIKQLQQNRQFGEQALRRIRTQLTEASSAQAEAAFTAEHQRLAAHNRELADQMHALQSRYPKGLPSKTELDTVSRAIDAIMLLKNRLQEKSSDYAAIETAPAQKKLHSSFLPLVIFGILSAAVGVCLLLLPELLSRTAVFAEQHLSVLMPILANRTVIGGSCCGTAIFSWLIGIFLQMKHKLHKEIDAVHAAAEAQRAEQLLAAIEAAEKKLDKLQAALDTFNRTYGLNVCDRLSLKTVERDVEQSERLTAAAGHAKQTLKHFAVEHRDKITAPSATENYDIDSLKEAEQHLLEKQSARNARLLQLEQQQRLLQTEIDRIPELTDELSRCTAQKTEDTEHRRLLDETVSFLQKARESLSHSYLGSVEAHFTEYLQYLTGAHPDKITVNPDLDVYWEQAGSPRPLTQFSAGETDLVQLCMRLALSDALFKEERCFMILDDPFVNLDDKHLKQALNLLRELGQTRQIIYLVCNAGRILPHQP